MFPPMNIVATYNKLKPSSRSFFCMYFPIQGFFEATFGFKGPVLEVPLGPLCTSWTFSMNCLVLHVFHSYQC